MVELRFHCVPGGVTDRYGTTRNGGVHVTVVPCSSGYHGDTVLSLPSMHQRLLNKPPEIAEGADRGRAESLTPGRFVSASPGSSIITFIKSHEEGA